MCHPRESAGRPEKAQVCEGEGWSVGTYVIRYLQSVQWPEDGQQLPKNAVAWNSAVSYESVHECWVRFPVNDAIRFTDMILGSWGSAASNRGAGG